MRSSRVWAGLCLSGALLLSGCANEPELTPAQRQAQAVGEESLGEYNRQQQILGAVRLGEGFVKIASENGGVSADVHEGESPEEHAEHAGEGTAEPGPTFSVDIYRTKLSPAESIRVLGERLSADGWDVEAAPNETDPAAPTAIEVYRGPEVKAQIVALVAGEGDVVVDSEFPAGTTQVRVLVESGDH